jgi:hypothetical protein
MRKAGAARPDSGAPAAKPRTVVYAVVAIIGAAVFALLSAIGVATQKDWIHREVHKADVKAVSSAVSSATASAAKKSKDVASASASASSSAVKKYPISGKKLDDQVSNQQKSTLIGSLVALLVNAFLAYGAWRGRHWTRWGVTGFFILSTFTGIGVGLLTLLNGTFASGVPAVVRVPLVIAGLAMIAAVVLVNLRPSTQYFALSRPVPPAGGAPRRGLFGRPMAPRGPAHAPTRDTEPPTAAQPKKTASTRPATQAPAAKDVDRSRTKKRTSADAVARGAELARTRAKASKSRRTER